MSEYLAFGKELALQAGQIMQSEREGRLRVQRKPDRTLVTHVDIAIQDLAIEAIVARFPGHAIIGEERSYGPKNAEHIWRIDPLDGTGEYVEGEGHELTYGFGLAKQWGSELEVGLFFNPSKNELFTAARGLGSYLNEQRIHVSRQRFRPGIAYDYSYWEGAHPDARFLDDQLGQPLGHYSAIYQGCMVALGKSAFSIFPGATGHDIAPAAILVAEAGGQVSDVRGQPHNWRNELHGAVFSNGVTHPDVIQALAA